MRKILSAATLLCSSPAMAQVTVTALPAGPIVENHTDLFDVSHGTIVTGGSGGFPGFAAEDALGGSNPSSLEPGNFVFNDFLFPQEVEGLDFRTAAPVTISGFNLFLGESGTVPTASRYFNSVKLLGSIDNVTFDSLGAITFAGPDYITAYGSHGILVQSLFASATYQYFRFEGLGPGFSGGRILELDAIAGTATPSGVPEPATWTMLLVGFGGIGFAMRRRPDANLRVRYV